MRQQEALIKLQDIRQQRARQYANVVVEANEAGKVVNTLFLCKCNYIYCILLGNEPPQPNENNIAFKMLKKQ